MISKCKVNKYNDILTEGMILKKILICMILVCPSNFNTGCTQFLTMWLFSFLTYCTANAGKQLSGNLGSIFRHVAINTLRGTI